MAVAFDAFFGQPVEPAEAYLERWYAGATRSRLEPVKAFARMIGDHWEGVVRWHWSRINNGALEAINSLVQASKRRARGYRNNKNLIAMIYRIAGRPDFSPAPSSKAALTASLTCTERIQWAARSGEGSR